MLEPKSLRLNAKIESGD